MEYRIGTDATGLRLDKYIRRVLPNVPLTAIYRLIRTKKVRINGLRAAEGAVLVHGDVVSVREQALQQRGGDTVSEARPSPASVVRTFGILHEDAHLLVCLKPGGLAMHPGTGVTGPTLVDEVRAYLASKPTVVSPPPVAEDAADADEEEDDDFESEDEDSDDSDDGFDDDSEESDEESDDDSEESDEDADPFARLDELMEDDSDEESDEDSEESDESDEESGESDGSEESAEVDAPTPGGFRPAPAHRIDRETSGIVLVGKTRPSIVALAKAFEEGTVRKVYLCVVRGRTPTTGVIDTPLAEKQQTAASKSTRGVNLQPALTRYRTLAQGRDASLCEVEIETGRTHQIRRHLAGIGHPLAGDSKYGDFVFNRHVARAWGLRRLFLHAARMGVDHPIHGQPMTFRAPLPAELCAVVDLLGWTLPTKFPRATEPNPASTPPEPYRAPATERSAIPMPRHREGQRPGVLSRPGSGGGGRGGKPSSGSGKKPSQKPSKSSGSTARPSRGGSGGGRPGGGGRPTGGSGRPGGGGGQRRR